jgi:hypothetical protein
MSFGNKLNLKKLACLVLAFVGTSAIAVVSQAKGGSGVLISVNPFYEDQKADVTVSGVTGSTALNTTNLDLELGYQMANGLYLGALVISDSSKSSTTAAGVTTTTNGKASGFGPTVGYKKGLWFVNGSYILSGEYDSNTSTTGKYKNGTGLAIATGLRFPMGSVFNLGAAINYRSIKYGTYNNGTTDSTTTTTTLTEMAPRVHLTFIF